MSLWRLEWYRLVRTRRLVALIGVHAFFGLTGPLTARYLATIVKRFGSNGIHVTVPPPAPIDGLVNYTSNAQQLGLLTVVLVTAAAVAFDGQRESAMFLRSRIDRVGRLVTTRFTMSALGACLGSAVGIGLAWYESWSLIGPLPAARVVAGAVGVSLFLVFAVGLTTFVAGVARSTAVTAAGALGALLVLAAVGALVPPLGRWLPTHLAGALPTAARGGPLGDLVGASVVTVAATAALVLAATGLVARRDV
jgi:ABC-2 type transport system permease protein